MMPILQLVYIRLFLGIGWICLYLFCFCLSSIKVSYWHERLFCCSEFTNTAVRGRLVAACKIFIQSWLIALQTVAQKRASRRHYVTLQVALLIKRLLLHLRVADPELSIVTLLHALSNLCLCKALLVGLCEVVSSDALLCR